MGATTVSVSAERSIDAEDSAATAAESSRPQLFVERRAFAREPRPVVGRLVVLIPALNEEETIAQVIGDIPRAIEGVGEVEVGLINDGSRDETVTRALAAGADFVTGHATNRGLAAAFNRGATAALA